jgi:predicted hotdog family 3-hydroxylacyl-ACP dehydratase
MLTDYSFPLAAEAVLPHRSPMRLIDELLACSNGTATVAASVQADSPLTDEAGYLEAVGLMEMLAQSFAAMQGYEDGRLGVPVRKGFLVGIRSFRIAGTAKSGDRLHIDLRTTANLGGFTLAEGEVRRGDEVLAAGSLKLWVPEEGGV